jgi:hypothetical protein
MYRTSVLYYHFAGTVADFARLLAQQRLLNMPSLYS